ncbi:MAG: thiamine-phosphate kinase [Nitrospirota bacterium]
MPRITEFQLIDQIARRQRTAKKSPSVLLGIGDDAAAVRPRLGQITLLTTDTLIEKTHFDFSYSTFFDIGYKAVSVNLSDIAAMGGTPRFFLVSLGLTGKESARDIDQLYRGIEKASQEANAFLIGGNITRSSTDFFVSITMVGEAPQKEIVTRSGGRPGDRLYVTGTLGDAAMGLHLRGGGSVPCEASMTAPGAGVPVVGRGEVTTPNKSFMQKLALKHRRPKARFQEGAILGQNQIPSAMIDVSDGLSSDLSHLVKASGVGVLLEEDKIPISSSLRRHAKAIGEDPLYYALNGGEDYELLFSVPESRIGRLEMLIQKRIIAVTPIGWLTEKRAGRVVRRGDGTVCKLEPLGYDHLKEGNTK